MDVAEWVERHDALMYVDEVVEPVEGSVQTSSGRRYVAVFRESETDIVPEPIFRAICENAVADADRLDRVDAGALRRHAGYGYEDAVEAWISEGVFPRYYPPEPPWDRMLCSAGYVDPGML